MLGKQSPQPSLQYLTEKVSIQSTEVRDCLVTQPETQSALLTAVGLGSRWLGPCSCRKESSNWFLPTHPSRVSLQTAEESRYLLGFYASH